jgi:hypothetical protein
VAEPGPPFDPDAAREAARRILERPEFAPPQRTWLDRALDWVGDQIARVVDWLASRLDRLFPDGDPSVGGGGQGVANLVAWLVLAGLLGVTVWFVARAVVRRRGRARRAKPAKVTAKTVVVVDRSREPDEWRTMAAARAAAGEWREALRCRYRALVGDLARRGLLDEIPGRTTGEERAQLSATSPPAAPTFSEATDLFDRVWYGDEPGGVGEHDRFAALEGEVLDRAGSSR